MQRSTFTRGCFRRRCWTPRAASSLRSGYRPRVRRSMTGRRDRRGSSRRSRSRRRPVGVGSRASCRRAASTCVSATRARRALWAARSVGRRATGSTRPGSRGSWPRSCCQRPGCRPLRSSPCATAAVCATRSLRTATAGRSACTHRSPTRAGPAAAAGCLIVSGQQWGIGRLCCPSPPARASRLTIIHALDEQIELLDTQLRRLGSQRPAPAGALRDLRRRPRAGGADPRRARRGEPLPPCPPGRAPERPRRRRLRISQPAPARPARQARLTRAPLGRSPRRPTTPADERAPTTLFTRAPSSVAARNPPRSPSRARSPLAPTTSSPISSRPPDRCN